MVKHGTQPAGGHVSLKVVGLIAVAAGILTLSALFIHNHSRLERLVEGHLHHGASRLHVKESEWQLVYNLAIDAKDRHEFAQLLKTEGLLHGTVPEEEDEDEEDEEDAEEESQRARQAVAKRGRRQSRKAGKAGAVVKAGEKAGENDEDTNYVDYSTINVYEEGPHDVSEADAEELEKAGDDDVPDWFTEGGLIGSDEDDDPALKPKNGNPPQMSVKLAHTMAVNNTVIVTWANYALWDFTLNWVIHVRKLGITNFLVGAMDAKIGQAMVERGIPSFAMYDDNETHSGVGDGHLQWGGQGFHKMGRQKISLAQLFLGTKLNLLLVDVDVVILRNVLQYFERYPEADILVSTDQLAPTIPQGEDGLEIPKFAGSPMNIGFMFFRYNANSTRFVDAWLAAITADDKYWDQNAFNDLARAGWDPATKLHPKNDRIFIGFNDSLAVGVLPTASFSGGHTFYIQRLHEIHQVEPYAVHCTFQYAGNIGKRNRMREAMIFEDPPEYYTGERYVSFNVERTPTLPPGEFEQLNYTQMKEFNVRGLQMQMESVYASLGLTLLFNRTIIMAPLACYCDRSWIKLEGCKVPGARFTPLPFLCPQDYVVDPIFMMDNVSPFVVRWREHSFLSNPRCPESVKRRRLTVYSTKEYKEVRQLWNVQEGGPMVLLPPGLPTAEIEKALAPYANITVWHFHNPSLTFSGFQDPDRQLAWRQRVDHLHPITQPANM